MSTLAKAKGNPKDYESEQLLAGRVRVIPRLRRPIKPQEELLYPDIPEVPDSISELRLWLITTEGERLPLQIPATSQEQILMLSSYFRQAISQNSEQFIEPAQLLYKLIVEPLEQELVNQEVDSLIFLMSPGLRSLPLAALHDGNNFLVEKYSTSLMPGFVLTNTQYKGVSNARVLALGVSKALGEFPAQPGVEQELTQIQNVWRGNTEILLNEEATLNNLINRYQNNRFDIVHLAIASPIDLDGPAENPGMPLWDGRLPLSEIGTLGLNNPSLELLVLSSANTGVGNDEAKFGFAGFATRSGVKTVLASLLPVGDEATAELMTEFYGNLNSDLIKAEALKEAQISIMNRNSHPFYWAGFTIIGSPW
ncbi:MAG: CHAT domain-containing protein [Cyanothece sp. SIO1E1]|nr:CHAT domain-containing protein [Cyanothece sp. SIO1E1]